MTFLYVIPSVVGTQPSIDISTYKVGTISCRFENKDDQKVLYLMTMGILAVSIPSFTWSKVILTHHD